MVPAPFKSNGKDKQIEHNFLKIYRYVKPNSSDNCFSGNVSIHERIISQHINISQVATTFKFYFNLTKRFVIFVEHCMKWTLLSFLTGNNYYKTKV